jgi:sugar lactone lactonase YvrE
MRRFAALLCLLFTLCGARTAQQLFEEAQGAYGRKDYPAYLVAMTELAALRPSHPVVVANHAGALALNGRADEAVRALQRIAAMRVAVDLADKDFDSLRGREDFRAIESALQALRGERISSASGSIRIPHRDLITEAITWDPKTRTFLVSAARKRKIYRLTPGGKMTELVGEKIWAVNGLGIDVRRRILWATSSPYERVEGFVKGRDEMDVALFAFHADSGALIARYNPPDDGRPHFFDDLTVAPDGTVFVSDSRGSLFRLTPGAGELERFAPSAALRSPQGSAWSDGILYVADYGGAIWAVDGATGDAARMALPEDFAPIGIDGLELHGGDLIAIQNGVQPNRVVRLTIGRPRTRVTSWKIVEMNHPLMDEPTIGTMVGRDFWFLAASQGGRFDAPEPRTLHDAVVLRIRL